MKPKCKTDVHIRWMIRRDMPEVLEIENDSFERPWCEEDFVRLLRQDIVRLLRQENPSVIGMVCEYDDDVIGFYMFELHKTRIHVLNFAVAPCHRHEGVGSQMVDKLVSKLSPHRRTRILLEVRETNLDAQLFFRNNGFRAVSVLRDYYDDTPEDAYVMEHRYQPDVSEMILPINRIARLAG